MKNTSQPAVKRLSLALKQSERALRNLQFVQVWAGRSGQEHLEQGAVDLVHRMAQFTTDLATLIHSVRAHSRGGIPPKENERVWP